MTFPCLRAVLALSLLVPAAGAMAADAPASATAGAELAACTELAPSHEIVRSSVQRLFLKDGDRHYRIEMRGDCASLPLASTIVISAEGQDNRLCPAGTRIKTNRENCQAAKISAIDAEEFARRKSRVRR